MKLPPLRSLVHFLSIGIGLQSALPAAIVSSTFTGGDPTDNWNAAANWSPVAVPINNATDQYEVTLPAALPNPVSLNLNPVLNSLTIGNGTTLLGQSGFGLTLAGGVDNDGLIEFSGTNSTARLFLDHPTDQAITVGGSGVIRLTGGAQNLSGAIGQQLIHGAGHTIEGYQTNTTVPVGNDRLNIVNQGTIRANVAGEFLALEPRDTLVNDGTLAAIDGGILRFVSGAFSGSGDFLIGDGSEFASNAASFTDVTITAVNNDADDRNNIFRAINNGTIFSGVTLGEDLLVTANSLPINFAGDVINDGLIELTGASSSFARLFVDHPADESITLGGSGTVRFTGGAQNINGAADQELVIGPAQTVEGFQTDVNASIGEGALNLINQGTIQANSPGQFLTIEARDTFLNTGTLAASDGGILRFDDGEFSGTGSYLIGDGSEFASIDASFKDVAFTAVDNDTDDRNNIFRIVNSGTDLDGVTFGKGILATTNNLPFNIRGDVTNDGLIELTGTGVGSRLFLDHPADQPITLDGAGIVRLTGESQNISGAIDQMLTIAPLQVIEGFQTNASVSIGQGVLLINNQGTILANENGQTLRVDPRNSQLTNDGHLIATDGGSLLVEAEVTGMGTIRADVDSDIEIDGAVTSGGHVRGGANSTILMDGSLTQVDGSLTIDGELTVGNFTTNRRQIDIQGGTIGGSGIISSSDLTLYAGSTLAPSASAGDLRLNINDFAGTTGFGVIFDFELVSDQVFSSVDFSDNTPVGILERGGGAGMSGELRLNLSGPASGFSTLPITIMKNIFATVQAEKSGGGFCTVPGGDMSFTNVNFGERLTTVDGKASFIVDATTTTDTNTCSFVTADYVTTVFLTDPLFAPEFVGAPFLFDIAESATVGSLVGTVVAVDPESDPVQYSLSGNGPFAIGLNNGEITTTGPLDFQSQSFYTVSVTATDGTLSNTTTVTIRETGAATDNEFCVQQLLTGAGAPFEGESDPAIIGFNADPDLDGIGNVFELWVGRDPATAEFGGIGTISPLQVGSEIFAALDISVSSAVDDLLVIEGNIGTDLTGFTPGTRSVRSDEDNSRALRFLSPAPAPSRAFGRFEAAPGATK
jgi:hypothetical protein